jgi:hypothetical protein
MASVLSGLLLLAAACASDIALAHEGLLVFAPTYHTDVNTGAGIEQRARDAEREFQLARTIAADLAASQPAGDVPRSLGASFVLNLGFSRASRPW